MPCRVNRGVALSHEVSASMVSLKNPYTKHEPIPRRFSASALYLDPDLDPAASFRRLGRTLEDAAKQGVQG